MGKESLTGPGEGNGNPRLGFSSGTVVKNPLASQININKSHYTLSYSIFNDVNIGLSIPTLLAPLWSVSTQRPENQNKIIKCSYGLQINTLLDIL